MHPDKYYAIPYMNKDKPLLSSNFSSVIYTIYLTLEYYINIIRFDINDLVLIIASLGISLSPTHPAWPQIEHLMDLDRPIKQGEPQPQMKPLELPKLKQIKK